MDFQRDCEVVLAALYLPGLGQSLTPNRRRWPAVMNALRCQAQGIEDSVDILIQSGFADEALILTQPGLTENAIEVLESGKALTVLDSNYPAGWLASLKETCPPALWQLGSKPISPYIGVLGSRDVPPEAHRFAADCARAVIEENYAVITGGAAGCDAAARMASLEAGGQTVTIVPFGLEYVGSVHPQEWLLSCAAPRERFTATRAMERNALIYAASSAAVIAHTCLKVGGTWHGSIDALRRKLCPVFVRSDPEEPGNRALSHLGAIPIEHPANIIDQIANLPAARTSYFELRAG